MEIDRKELSKIIEQEVYNRFYQLKAVKKEFIGNVKKTIKSFDKKTKYIDKKIIDLEIKIQDLDKIIEKWK